MTERAFSGIVDYLQERYGELTQAAVARKLKLRQPQVSQYRREGPRRQSTWKRLAGRIFELGYDEGVEDTARLFMDSLVDTFGRIAWSSSTA